MTRCRWRAARARRAARSAPREPVSGVDVVSFCGAPSCVPTLSNGGAPPCAPISDRGSVLLALIAHQHLIAKLAPDGLVDLGKARLESNLRDVARSREGDGK